MANFDNLVNISETLSQRNLHTYIAEYPSHGLHHKVQIIAGNEPLKEDGSPPHHEARMEDKMALKKGIIWLFLFNVTI